MGDTITLRVVIDLEMQGLYFCKTCPDFGVTYESFPTDCCILSIELNMLPQIFLSPDSSLLPLGIRAPSTDISVLEIRFPSSFSMFIVAFLFISVFLARIFPPNTELEKIFNKMFYISAIPLIAPDMPV